MHFGGSYCYIFSSNWWFDFVWNGFYKVFPCFLILVQTRNICFKHLRTRWCWLDHDMSNLLGIIRHLFIELGGGVAYQIHANSIQYPTTSTILFQDNSANYTSAATTCGGWRRLGGLRTVRVDDAKEVLACDASSRATWSTTSTRSPTPWGVWLFWWGSPGCYIR